MSNRATIYLVFNNDGDVTSHEDRDEAIEAFTNNYVGEFRVAEMTVTLPTWDDIQATASIPADKVGPIETAE